DLGIQMQVTPHVYRDQGGVYVQLELAPEVAFYSGSSNGVPIRAVRSSESVANVRDKQTLVIGGITLNDERHTEQKVPVLGHVPVLGVLFRHKERTREAKELMVFVTPTVHERPETVTWDRMLNLSISEQTAARTAPLLPSQSESGRTP
ncbi:MAG TPA: hypothetical protein ENN80_04040, partial [Candidatus Hydrogenedentes bacterium]|nr:hypothetical protein [Candidatus Hydrogenedentota bacterium]